MAEALLTTKLRIPPARTDAVLRQRLHQRLNDGLAHRLTLISAPAGFGKTSLVSGWAGQANALVAWLAIDEGDDDIIRFLTYLIAALQTLDPDIGQTASTLLHSPQPSPPEAICVTLINDLAAHTDPFIFILDDYHLIESPTIHQTLTFLLEHLPANAHLIIATRADPPLPLAQLRGRGQLLEIRQADLRFTPEEAATFLAQTMSLDLPSDQIATLATHTEGWIAGLQMAAASLWGKDDSAAFVESFTGSNRYVLDYFAEEVLQRQPPDLQEFLLQTAVVDRLNAALCDAITGRDDGQKTLEYLERRNLFIVPLDDDRRWYRYHRLFADLLHQRLHRTQGDQVAEYHRRAGAWYVQAGLMAEAIDHALATADFEWAAELIETLAKETLMRSELNTLARWVDALPDAVIRTRPSLCIYHAWALLLTGGAMAQVTARLQDAERGQISAEATTLRALIAAMLGDAAHSLTLSQQALASLPPESAYWRSIAYCNVGKAQVLLGDIAAATAAFDEAVQLGRQAGNLMFAVGALSDLAGLCQAQGQLHRAAEIGQRALDLACDAQGRRLPVAARALLTLGELAREHNDLAAAEKYLTECLALFQRFSTFGALIALIHLARLKQAQGASQEANDLLNQARQLALESDAVQLDDRLVEVSQARLWHEQGRWEDVGRWISEQGLSPEQMVSDSTSPGAYDLHQTEQTILARWLLYQERTTEALQVLTPLRQSADKQGRTRRLIEVVALEALAHAQNAAPNTALTTLAQALELAAPEGYVRIFVDEGPPMAQLLYQALEQGFLPQYTGSLLAAFPATPEPSRGASPELVEPLSARELEVLDLIAAGATNPEIAHRLSISVYTVKKHVTNLFGKLAVRSRTQAVARARDLGLLADQ